MTSTIEHAVGPDWLLVASAKGNVAIQHAQQGQIEVHVGEGVPDALDVGIVVGTNTSGLPSHFAVAALPPEAQVWVRSLTGGARIVVLSY